jgi:AcrR family transcriptional regulator
MSPPFSATRKNGHSMAVPEHKSATVSQRRGSTRKDERVRRTRARIDAAFVELLRRRGYGDIRVSGIVKKAGVGRPTFYAHYAAKDDLLRSQLDRIVAPMLDRSPGAHPRLDATRLFEHVRSDPRIYRALMGPDGGSAPRVLRDCFEARIRRALSLDESAGASLSRAAMSRFVAASLITVIECWLERGAREAPRDVQALFARLATLR